MQRIAQMSLGQCYSWDKLTRNGNDIGILVRWISSQCDSTFMGEIYFSNWNSEQVDRGVWWRRKGSACFTSGAEFEDAGTSITNIAKDGPAHQGHMKV